MKSVDIGCSHAISRPSTFAWRTALRFFPTAWNSGLGRLARGFEDSFASAHPAWISIARHAHYESHGWKTQPGL